MLDQENLHHLVLIPDFVNYQPSKVEGKHLILRILLLRKMF